MSKTLIVVISLVFLVALAGYIGVSKFKGKSSDNSSELDNKSQSKYPVSVENCGKSITFDSAPTRALVFETNMTEIMLALGLENKTVGYWTSGVPVGSQFQEKIQKIPRISDKTWPPPGMETIMSFNPDFVFGGWEYNFSDESGVNPDKLAAVSVKSYILSE